jgi:hypothetical protein
MCKPSVRWLALVLVVGVAACSPGACAERMVEEAIEAETGGEVDLDSEGGELSVAGPDGETVQVGESVPLPEDLPSFIPVYPESVPRMVISTGEGTQISLEVADAASAVVAWYRNQLETNGFEIRSDMASPMGTVLACERGDGTLGVTVMEIPGDNRTVITLMWDGG